MSTVEKTEIRAKKPNKFQQPKSNKLNLGTFHRYDKNENRKRKQPNLKKRVRDIERLLSKPGLPEGMIKAKTEELKELKKQEKDKRHINTLESKYKQVRFFEKKKALRKQKQANKRLEDLQKDLTKDNTEAIAATQKEIIQHASDIEYISFFPDNMKYIALYAGEHTEQTKKKIGEIKIKIKKVHDYREKMRLKEMVEADGEKQDKKKIEEAEEDGFFANDDDSIASSDVEPEAIVDRTGKIIRPRDDTRKRDVKFAKKKDDKPQAPIRINPRNYRVGKGELANKAPTKIKF